MELSFLRPVYARPGPWSSVYLDASRNCEGAQTALELRWRGLAEELVSYGADLSTVAALGDVVLGHEPLPGNYGFAAFAADGQVGLAQYLAAPPVKDLAAYAPLPHTMPLIAQRGEQIPWVRVLADRTGADVCAVSAGGVQRRTTVAGGETFPLRRVEPGGWSQSHYQRAAVEAWHHNAGDVAKATVHAAEAVDAEVVVLAGDVRATGVLAAQLPERWQARMVRTDAGARDIGADPSTLDDITVQLVAEVADEHIGRTLDRFGMQEEVGEGLDAVVEALRRAQVDTMLLVDDPSAVGELWIGPAPTDIALNRDALDGEAQRVRADAALVRALVGTDAEINVLGPEEGPVLTDGLGAVLRYTDAATPGTGRD
ncbi:baeRF2 domain-containing protein [Melissospora conviva]|uniref:baeRF2 domain-containing protein n=1 Tax=Melissospora conviva TaxID=3388432 RepID=UPI003C147AF5